MEIFLSEINFEIYIRDDVLGLGMTLLHMSARRRGEVHSEFLSHRYLQILDLIKLQVNEFFSPLQLKNHFCSFQVG